MNTVVVASALPAIALAGLSFAASQQAPVTVSAAEFLASLLLGLLSVLVPLALFIGAVAVCVSVARWWQKSG